MNYDIESNILSWEVARGEIDHVLEVGNFLIHVSKSRKPLYIEILEASKFVGQMEKINIAQEIKKAMPLG